MVVGLRPDRPGPTVISTLGLDPVHDRAGKILFLPTPIYLPPMFFFSFITVAARG